MFNETMNFNIRIHIIILGLAFFYQHQTLSQTKTIYLIPGQGSDYRIFDHLQLPANYDTVYIKHLIPEKRESLKSYAKKISRQIDTLQSFSIIGVSLGGMVAVELAEIVDPEKVIVVSSAKTRFELPRRYTFMKQIPIYRAIPPLLYKYGSYMAQPIVEPDRRNEKNTFIHMLKSKDPVFLKRATHIIVNWQKEEYAANIIHLHGTNDHTIPYKNIKSDFTISGGSHMMMLTRSVEINELIKSILEAD